MDTPSDIKTSNGNSIGCRFSVISNIPPSSINISITQKIDCKSVNIGSINLSEYNKFWVKYIANSKSISLIAIFYKNEFVDINTGISLITKNINALVFIKPKKDDQTPFSFSNEHTCKVSLNKNEKKRKIN